MNGVETWQAGDWVLDANGRVWVRADDEDTGKGWPWGYPQHTARWTHQGHQYVVIPEGSVEEDLPTRPLSLLLRDGYPVPYQAA